MPLPRPQGSTPHLPHVMFLTRPPPDFTMDLSVQFVFRLVDIYFLNYSIITFLLIFMLLTDIVDFLFGLFVCLFVLFVFFAFSHGI